MIRLTDDSEKEPIIQLSPMIDLVFLLLVVFIVATMYLTQTHALPVNLPKGEAPLVEQKAVTVTIDKKEPSIWMERHFHRRNLKRLRSSFLKRLLSSWKQMKPCLMAGLWEPLKSCAAPASQIFPLL